MSGTTEKPDAIAEIRAFYAHYIECFNSGDVAAANACYAYPWNFVMRGEVVAMTSPNIGKGMFKMLYDRLRPLGWVATETVHVDIFPAGVKCGLIKADYRRVRGDGSVLETGSVCYMVERTDAGWHFTACISNLDVRAPLSGQ